MLLLIGFQKIIHICHQLEKNFHARAISFTLAVLYRISFYAACEQDVLLKRSV